MSPIQPAVQASPFVFDRRRVRLHCDRAADSAVGADFLFQEMADRVIGRLADIGLSFPLVLNLGAHAGLLGYCLKRRTEISSMVQAGCSWNMLRHASDCGHCAVADEEFLPFAENSFDLIVSIGALHWVNDLPGALVQINRTLKEGGLFLAIMLGGQTLKELRYCLEGAEMALSGGISPRISPFVDVQAAGDLLVRAGFSEPVADGETLTVTYADPLTLIYDLRAMGQTNALSSSSKHFTRRGVLFTAMDQYERRFARENGLIPATFELVTMTGWR